MKCIKYNISDFREETVKNIFGFREETGKNISDFRENRVIKQVFL